MITVEKQTYDAERAFYGSNGIKATECVFDGPADGESAFKECKNTEAEKCRFNLRYPFWHDDKVRVSDSVFTENCRAAFWYSKNIDIKNSKLHGIKALRECENVKIAGCDINSAEFGWSVGSAKISDTSVHGEYFMMRSEKLDFYGLYLKGKYSFQYTKNVVVENSTFDTKDAFWHAENVTLRNCNIKGEYLGWYSKNLTFENCRIGGTQPFCYCTGLNLINCTLEDADLCFEKSEVYALITNSVVSIKNPREGKIYLPEVKEIIRDDPESKCDIIEVNAPGVVINSDDIT